MLGTAPASVSVLVSVSVPAGLSSTAPRTVRLTARRREARAEAALQELLRKYEVEEALLWLVDAGVTRREHLSDLLRVQAQQLLIKGRADPFPSLLKLIRLKLVGLLEQDAHCLWSAH